MTRLSDTQMLALAAAKTWPHFKLGERVIVLFSVQDPIEGVVTQPTDDRGWIEVQAYTDPDDPMSGYKFPAMAAATLRKGEAPTDASVYRLVDEHPYLDREEEAGNLTATEAATEFENRTGEPFDQVLAELDESCNACTDGTTAQGWLCATCGGTGRRHDPIEWEDPETGRTVVLRPEVS